jgi:hypothetical protein
MKTTLYIDLVPYEFSVKNIDTLVMNSKYFAEKLAVKSRFKEKYEGYRSLSNKFLYVEADEVEGTVTFSCEEDMWLEELIQEFFGNRLDAILSIGYECLERNI